MEPTSDVSKVEPVNRKRRFRYVVALTAALIVSSIGYAAYFPESKLSETIIDNSYSVLTVVVISYLASSTVDYNGLLTNLPIYNRRSTK